MRKKDRIFEQELRNIGWTETDIEAVQSINANDSGGSAYFRPDLIENIESAHQETGQSRAEIVNSMYNFWVCMEQIKLNKKD